MVRTSLLETLQPFFSIAQNGCRCTKQTAPTPAPLIPHSWRGTVAETIVRPDFEDMNFVVGEEVVAKIHHVVLDLARPVVPQSIFSAEAKHPSADRLVRRNRGKRAAGDGVHRGRNVDTDVGPGAAHFAVDEPTIKGPPDPCSEGGNPIEARFGVRRSDREPGRDEGH